MNRNAKIALVCALLTAATAAVYAETASFDFVALDDPLHVTRNPMVRAGLSADGVRWAFSETHAGYWIPLTWISHMIDCEIHGLSPAGPHLANLALHIVNALLVFLVLLRATGRLVPSAFAAALFALHPLRVESVAWVTERKDVLSTAFGLASTLAYLAFAVRGGALRYGAVALLFAASLMAKPMLVTLPLVFLLLDAWPLDRLGRRQLLEKLPLLAISLVFSIVAVVANSAHGALPGTDAIPVHLRLANAAVSCVRYLGATFWPADLAAFYPHPYLPDGTPWSPAQVLGSLGLLLGISGALVWRAALDRAALVGWLWFLGTLVPVLGLVQAGEQAMADRFTYFPSIGLAIAITWTAAGPTGAARWRRPAPRIALAVAACAWLTALGVASFHQARHWRDAATLFERILTTAPEHPVMRIYYALWLRQEGLEEDALRHLRLAVDSEGGAAAAHYNIGVLFAERGRAADAAEHFETAIDRDPTLADAHARLGLAHLRRGEIDRALPYLRVAVQLRPDRPLYGNALARALATHPDPDRRDPLRAVALANRAAQMTDFADPRVLDTLALAHAAAGDPQRAARATRAALAIAERTGDRRLAARLRARLPPAPPGSGSGAEVEGAGPDQRFVPDP